LLLGKVRDSEKRGGREGNRGKRKRGRGVGWVRGGIKNGSGNPPASIGEIRGGRRGGGGRTDCLG